MDELHFTEEMYQENILDHYKNPHNKGKVAHPSLQNREKNPSCGDEIEITTPKGKIQYKILEINSKVEVGYWPILEKSYWISPFSYTFELRKLYQKIKPDIIHLNSTKAGIIGFTKAAAKEFASRNITVNAIAPGLIDTPLTQNLKAKVLQDLIEAQPTKKMGKPEDIASAVAFLLSDESNFITGQILHVDGGKSIGSTIF